MAGATWLGAFHSDARSVRSAVARRTLRRRGSRNASDRAGAQWCLLIDRDYWITDDIESLERKL